jgi:hypothetical protein
MGVCGDAGAGFDAPDFSFGIVGSGIASDCAIKLILQLSPEVECFNAT